MRKSYIATPTLCSVFLHSNTSALQYINVESGKRQCRHIYYWHRCLSVLSKMELSTPAMCADIVAYQHQQAGSRLQTLQISYAIVSVNMYERSEQLDRTPHFVSSINLHSDDAESPSPSPSPSTPTTSTTIARQ